MSKIGDTIVMNYCEPCETVFKDDEEGRCPHCWDIAKEYAILKFEGVELAEL